jgi:hypothetical protein
MRMPHSIEARIGADFRVRPVRPARAKVRFQRITKAARFNFYFVIMRFLLGIRSLPIGQQRQMLKYSSMLC